MYRLAFGGSFNEQRSLPTTESACFTLPVPPGGARTSLAQQSTARFERFIRDTFDRNITYPVPEASYDLFWGYSE
ncbi:hypothetical protein N7463_005854 [Penicillium fimorum]|uniref:Uncharacterized protein n=1 Tax=Penicillium fimorum TaxID=1882269 RepID=A0A9W9XUV5_9EURO|nr:hypothetical protein N7463_005854 [Penicillium fimorum]